MEQFELQPEEFYTVEQLVSFVLDDCADLEDQWTIEKYDTGSYEFIELCIFKDFNMRYIIYLNELSINKFKIRIGTVWCLARNLSMNRIKIEISDFDMVDVYNRNKNSEESIKIKGQFIKI